MAKCRLCRKLISDGTEYCTDCAEKKDLVANESYLDNLLNSVQSNTTTASDIYKRKKEDHSKNSPDIIEPSNDDKSDFLDPEDLGEFEQYDIMNELDDPIIISNEDLYGENSLSPSIEHNIDNEFLEMNEENEQNLLEDEYIEPVLGDLLRHLNMGDNNDVDNNDVDNNDDVDGSDNASDNDKANDNDDVDGSDNADDNDITREDFNTYEDLLQSDIDFAANSNLAANNDDMAAEKELLDLLNQFNPDNQGDDDIQAISDLLGGIDASNQQMREYPGDVGEVFSEALEAVTELSDIDQDIFSEKIPDPKVKKDKKEKDKKEKDKKEKKEKKAGFFSRLFDDTDDEDENLDPEKKKTLEEAANAKIEKKKNKKKKGKIDQMGDREEGDEGLARGGRVAESSDKKQKVKKAKKEKKKKIEILDDDVDEGRINKTGASFVFLFFGLLVVILLISTNVFSYSLSIRNATDYFGRQRYTQAYNEVYGIELNDEDIELYDKIMTVMYVNKQLNSYNNYYHMRKFPEALDSLLKGLQRYDKYIELATMLGIKTDLDYVRNQIVAELYSVFSLTEEQAMNIISSESQANYSIAVYDVILENISFFN